MKRSETVGNSRKRSETVGNGRKHDQAKTCPTRIFLKWAFPRNAVFFFEGPKVSKRKRLETVGDRTFARQKRHVFTQFLTFFMNICYKATTFLPSEGAISDCFQPFPFGHLCTFKKKRRCAEMLILKKCGLNKFWPDHVSDRFRPFPTVSDRFIFSERLIRPIPFMEGWSSANPCKPWRLSFLVPPLCAYTAPNIASWPWYPIFPKNHKIPGAREI